MAPNNGALLRSASLSKGLGGLLVDNLADHLER